MAPEQLEGGRGDERSDLYSLGATIYEMSFGAPPYAGQRDEILDAQRSKGPSELERADLPQGLIDLILTLLATEPDLRTPMRRTLSNGSSIFKARKPTSMIFSAAMRLHARVQVVASYPRRG